MKNINLEKTKQMFLQMSCNFGYTYEQLDDKMKYSIKETKLYYKELKDIGVCETLLAFNDDIPSKMVGKRLFRLSDSDIKLGLQNNKIKKKFLILMD